MTDTQHTTPLYVFIDLETYSEADLRACGGYKYAEDPTTTILLMAYGFADGEVKVWDRTVSQEMPADLKDALDRVQAGRGFVVGHNIMAFDSIVIWRVLGIYIDPKQIIDTMVLAYEHGLPGALGDLCTVFRLPVDQAKDKDGARLVQIFCKPAPKNHKARRYTRADKPDDWARFVNYCRLDVVSMRRLFDLMPKWNVSLWERRLQALDASINRRGICMDKELAVAALAEWEKYKKTLDKKVHAATGGALYAATQRDALLNYLDKTYGFQLETMAKSELEKRLGDDSIPEPVRNLISLRLASTKNSVAKYRPLLAALAKDGRIHGMLQFRGAQRTGRWSGRLWQPQNLARPTMSQDAIDAAIPAVKAGIISAFYEDVGEVLSNCLRGEIVAPEGMRLVVADYSNIEGRVLAWAAGEAWKLDAFRAYDNGTGPDLYKLMYGRAFNVDPKDVTKPQRQLGKVMELALGYGGGAGAFASFAALYGVDLHALAVEVRKTVSPTAWAKAEDSYETFFKPRGLTEGLDKEVFMACDVMKNAWRDANPHIKALWKKTGESVVETILSGQSTRINAKVACERRGNYLLVQLPSGRYLTYASPRVEEEGDGRTGFSYSGLDPYKHKWGRVRSYGAKAVENIVQAIACDVLSEGLLSLDVVGFKTVLTIHDEVLAEAPNNRNDLNLKRMSDCMTSLPQWGAGLPLSVAGYEATRYRKD